RVLFRSLLCSSLGRPLVRHSFYFCLLWRLCLWHLQWHFSQRPGQISYLALFAFTHFLQLLAQSRCSETLSPTQATAAEVTPAKLDVSRLLRYLLAKHAGEAAGTEHATVPSAKAEETDSVTIAGTAVAAGEDLGDIAGGERAVVDEDVAQRRDAAAESRWLEQWRRQQGGRGIGGG